MGKVEPLESADITSDWPTLVSSVKIQKGQHVRKGQIVAEVDNRESKFYLAYYQTFTSDLMRQIERLDSDLNFLEKRQKKLRDLASKGIITVTEVEKIETTILDAQKAKLTADNQLKTMRAEIATREKQIAKANLVAPFDGIVDQIMVDPKQMVGSFILDARTALARIIQPNVYKIKAVTFDQDVIHLHEGDNCVVVLEGGSREISGTIASIDPYVKQGNPNPYTYANEPTSDQKSQPKYSVTITFREAAAMPNGVGATAKFNRNFHEQGLALPWNAIFSDVDQTHVRVYDADKGFEDRVVTLGSRNDTHVIVRTGLQANDLVYARVE